MLQWFRESVSFKPFRSVFHFLLSGFHLLLGILGRLIQVPCLLLTGRGLNPKLKPRGWNHVVVVRPDRLGDMILATPFLRALRQLAPTARITVIASDRNKDAIQGLATVDEVLAVPGDRIRDFWRSRAILSPVRASRPDAVIALEAKWSAGLLSFWLRGRHRIGYDRSGMGWLFYPAVSYPYGKNKTHQVEVNLRLLKPLGFDERYLSPSRWPLEVAISDSARDKAADWLQQAGLNSEEVLVMVHPGSRSVYTRWNLDRYATLIAELQSFSHVRILLLSGPGEESLAEELMQSSSGPLILVKDLELPVLAALMEQCALYIGNATGTLHLAAAVCPHVIGIIGGTHPEDCPERWGPWGVGHRVVHRAPKDVLGKDTWRWLGPEGLRHIRVEDVMEPVQEVLGS